MKHVETEVNKKTSNCFILLVFSLHMHITYILRSMSLGPDEVAYSILQLCTQTLLRIILMLSSHLNTRCPQGVSEQLESIRDLLGFYRRAQEVYGFHIS